MRECCQKEENLKEIESRSQSVDVTIVVHQCAVCGAKHHEMSVPPIRFGMSGKGM